MTRWIVGMCAVLTAGVAVAVLHARQDAPVGNAPGMPTVARTYVLNRESDEAVPVTLTAGGDIQPVELVGRPLVRVSEDGTLSVRTARQGWEYRQVAVTDDLDEALADAGEDGWEAVAVVNIEDDRSAVLLKRPR